MTRKSNLALLLKNLTFLGDDTLFYVFHRNKERQNIDTIITHNYTIVWSSTDILGSTPNVGVPNVGVKKHWSGQTHERQRHYFIDRGIKRFKIVILLK